MNIDVSKIVEDKLKQLDEDGIIKSEIEKNIEKTIKEAVSSALGGWELKRDIEKQVSALVSPLAADCGLGAYNGYVANATAAVVRQMFNDDIAKIVKDTLNGLMLQKHEGVKLSDIFNKYRKWVNENVYDSEKRVRENYLGELVVEGEGNWKRVICKFDAESGTYYGGEASIVVRFYYYAKDTAAPISTLLLGGCNLKEGLGIGSMDGFEMFVANLYYNKTNIIMDIDDVDDSDVFDVADY
jgi:hypothetical protein